MFCPYCGTQIEDTMKFCFNCGKSLDFNITNQAEENVIEETTIKDISENPAEESIVEKQTTVEAVILNEQVKSEKVIDTNLEVKKEEKKKEKIEEPINHSSVKKNSKQTMRGKVKSKIAEGWSKLSIFGKITTIVILSAIVWGLIAFLAGRVFAMLIAIVQLLVVIVALLMRKEVIKVSQKWISPLLLAISVILAVPYVSLFKINMADYEKYAWEDVVLADMLPEPESPYGQIESNSKSYLWLEVWKVEKEEYNKYVEACEDAGFIIDAEQIGTDYYAYNEAGYKLILSYYEYDSEMYVHLNEGMQLGELSWSNSEIAQLLPIPESTIGELLKDDETEYSVYVGNMPKDAYASYITACEEKGFNVEARREEKYFSAKNPESYKLSVEYIGNGIIHISVEEPEFKANVEVECVENWFLNKYDVNIYVDDYSEGTIVHGNSETYELILTKGNHTIKFVNADDETKEGIVEIIVSKDETFKFKISCASDGVDVEVIAGSVNQPEIIEESNNPENSQQSETVSEITVTIAEKSFRGMKYEEAEKKFREMGFTSFKYVKENSENVSEDGRISYIEIKELFIGDSDFEVGDTFDADSTVILRYYVCEEKTEVSNLTVENCEDLATVLAEKNPESSIVSSFSTEYRGKIIEFDGCVANSQNHGNYDTRYDILIYAGNYDPNSAKGPQFQFEDVNYSNLGLSFSDNINDYIETGTNLHIVAEVGKFDPNTGLFKLKPVSIKKR